jgi:hypothetical protein
VRPRIPNVALATPVPIAAEARIAPSKPSCAVRVALPPGLSLDPQDEHYLVGAGGTRWRIDGFSQSDEVRDALRDALTPAARGWC